MSIHAMYLSFVIYGDDAFSHRRHAHDPCGPSRAHADAHGPICHADGYARAPDWRREAARSLRERSRNPGPS